MQIGIIGTGAMGSLLAAHLAPHADVTVVGTWTDGVRAIETYGIRLEQDGKEIRVPVRAVRDPRQCAPVDLALVAVKGHQTARAAAWARMVLKPEGIALTLQNGLGNFETLAEQVGLARAAMGVSMQGATLLGPGHVRHAGRGPTTLGTTRSTYDHLAQAAALLNHAGLETHLTDDVNALLWGKLVVNSAINALSAILQVQNGWLAEDPNTRAIMSAAAQETANVAAALGITLPFTNAAERAIQVAKATAANHSSTLQDVLRGAPTELERINGAVVREGKRLGVATPVNESLMNLFRARQAAHTRPLPLRHKSRVAVHVATA